MPTPSAPGSRAHPADPASETPPEMRLVAFDFDGTLTVRDSFAAFLLWRAPLWRLGLAAARVAPAALAYLVSRDRGRFKSAAFKALIGRMSVEALACRADAFADEVAERLLRPDAVACWNAHRAAADHLVIVTASPEILVAPFAHRLGADRLIGTRLSVDAEGRIDGDLDGANCRGPEKVVRLQVAYGRSVRLAAAYGDTAGDLEMLALADRPCMRRFIAKPLAAR